MDLSPDHNLKATESALNDVTNDASDHQADPKNTLHKPADHNTSHSWLSKFIPASTLQNFENNWHLVGCKRTMTRKET